MHLLWAQLGLAGGHEVKVEDILMSSREKASASILWKWSH